MGVASSNRGARVISREADELVPGAGARADRHALKDENDRLRERVAALEHDLSRARRCLAAERHGREQLRQRLAAGESAYQFAVGILCRLAFPKPPREG